MRCQPTRFQEFFGRADACCRFRPNGNALGLSSEPHPLGQSFFADRYSAAIAFRYNVEHHEVTDGSRYAQPTCNCDCIFEGIREPLAILEGSDDRTAAIRLHRNHPRHALPLQPAQLSQFLKPLPHTDQSGTAAGRIENNVGQCPIELLGQLQSHRLLALDSIRFLQRRDIEPTHRFLAIENDLCAVIDQTIDEIPVSAGLDDFILIDFRRILRHEHVGFHSRPGCIGCHRPAGVAGSGNCHSFDAEPFRHRNGDRLPTILEGTCRHLGFVFDKQISQTQRATEPITTQQGRHAFTE